MTPQDIRAAVIEELENIAPEADASAVPGDADLREELDIDSMDVLNFVTALHKRLKVDIPDRDQPKLLTIDGAVAYLQEKLAARTG
ncbi:acyl carrier protein [Ferruginivarius sediminum]|uniref:Acyl carrier protein n=1 Tax=Ferruginivarius sediminum TaxID=2661937 RepID=A0A369T6T1_9PROT|nr:acyl carrier protein [Ferruginivarius sediminum]RDD61033.1 acyl carrier protein [Ferruginivarius sediminum]